jgi:thiol-disulfide isomerase/thioredoxin
MTTTFSRILAAFVLAGATAFAHALETKPYSAGALTQAQQAGKPVAVLFHADWCPTCKTQEKVLQGLKAEPGLDVTVLVANYDTEKDLKRRMRVNSQSTLVVMRGDKETARLVGDTAPDKLRAALKSAL